MKKAFTENGSFLRIAGTQLLLLVLLLVALFTQFYVKENGDMNAAVLGILLAPSIVLPLCIYNGLMIALWNRILKNGGLLNYWLPILPLVIWFVASDNEIVIGSWKFHTTDFYSTMLLILLVNTAGFYLFKGVDQNGAKR